MVKMNKIIRHLGALLFAALFCLSPAFAVGVPAMNGRVNDYAKIIRDSDEREIEEYLAGLEQSSGIQIAVLTMPSLEGEDISSFGIRVADKWKLGDKEKDNGAILIVAYAEHDLRIEVGDGLEGSLTDAKCGLILRNVIVPEFRDGNYSGGIMKGVKDMGAIAAGDESAVSRSVREGEDNSGDDSLVPVFVIIVWLIFFVSMISAGARRNRRRGRYYHNGNTIAWIAADAALRSIMRGSGGGSGLGGHSSGGFGGFSGGGGHFSGGGASAHW